MSTHRTCRAPMRLAVVGRSPRAAHRVVARRLPYTLARRAVDALLRGYPSARLVRDGEDGWSFVVCECEDNTTSYVHRDGTVEWYGTPWPNGDCDVCMEEERGETVWVEPTGNEVTHG